MTRSKAPRTYIIQPGVLWDWAGRGGSGGGAGGAGGGSTGGAVDGVTGSGTITGGDPDGGTNEAGGDSVLKVPAALQAL